MDTVTGTALTVAERASVALGSSAHEKKLIALAKQSTEIVAITNAAGYQQLHAARMMLKNERIGLEKLGKAARDDATKFSKAVIAEQARLIGIIDPEERRLEAIQAEHDTRIEREKAAKIEAERVRVERIQAALQGIRETCTGLTIASGSAVIEATLAVLNASSIDEDFAEFRPDAEKLKVQAATLLHKLHGEALEYEEIRRKAKADAEELSRLKADEERRKAEAAVAEAEATKRREAEERAHRERIAAEELAAADRIAAQARAATAERDEADRKARQALAEQEAAAKAIRDGEDKRLREEAAKLAAEARALEERQRAERDRVESAERAIREDQARQQEAKERAAREAEESKQREMRRQAAELMDGRSLLKDFRKRFGDVPEFSPVTKAIDAYFASIKK